MPDKSILESIYELDAMSKQLNDPEFDKAMEIVIKCIKTPEVPVKQVAQVITQLSALSAKFAIATTWYKSFGKSGEKERWKKDAYYTARHAIDNLVDSLKYQQRAVERRF